MAGRKAGKPSRETFYGSLGQRASIWKFFFQRQGQFLLAMVVPVGIGRVVLDQIMDVTGRAMLEMTVAPEYQDRPVTEVSRYAADAENDDYRLSDDSPAYRLGFERIPVERIGVRG